MAYGFQPARKTGNPAARGFDPAQARRYAAGLKNGGMVRGPGTGTSDDIETEVPEGSYIMPADTTAKLGAKKLASMGSARGFPGFKPSANTAAPVPVNLSNGEYQMPPEQVHAVGVQTLNQIKDATHVPAARGFHPEWRPARQDERRLYLAGGGLVEDERKRANSFGDAAAAAGNPAMKQVASAPLATFNSLDETKQALGQMQAASRAQMAADVAPRSTAGTPPSQPVSNITKTVDAQGHTSYSGGNIGSGATINSQKPAGGYMQMPSGLARGFYPAQASASPIQQAADTDTKPVNAAARGFPGFRPSTPSISQPVTPSIDRYAPAAPAADTAPVNAGARGFPGFRQPAPQVAPGVYQHARGQYSDNPTGMGFSADKGNPSANNLAAADALASRSAADVSNMAARGFPGYSQQFSPPQVAHSGNDWQARNELRNADVSANGLQSSWDNWRNKGGASPEQQQYASLLGADQEARKQASGMPGYAMKANADLARTGMQEQGATGRNALDNATRMADVQARGFDSTWKHRMDEARLGLDSAKFGLESQARGFDIRAAQQMEGLRERVLNPNVTPEQRTMATQLYQTLSGKGKATGQQPQLPTPALKMQQEELDALGVSSAIGADLGAINKQLDSGQLNLGPVRNLWNKGRNAIGASTSESRNLASFEATLEKLRNDSLKLNKGVQTEGDAQRAWNEVLKSTSDPALVRKRLAEVQGINQRAADLRAANISKLRENFGAPPLDTAPYRNVAPAIGNQQPQGRQPARQADDWGKQWGEMPSGTLYTAPDGSIRRKK